MKTIRVTPSDIGFIWDKCRRCWYRKANGLQRVKEAFPVMFQTVDTGMKLAAPQICDVLGIEVKTFQRFEKVLSDVILFEEYGVQCQVSGKVDKCIEHADGTYGVIEYKMAPPTPENVAKYKAQCHAYVEALENPVKGKQAHEVSTIDLIFLHPTEDMVACKKIDSRAFFSLKGEIHHVAMDIDRAWFHDTVLRPMAECAGSLEMPPPGEWCEFCASIRATEEYERQLSKLAEKVSA